MTRAVPPPRSVQEALERAAAHGRAAIAEGLAACRALLDAAALVAVARPAEQAAGLATVAALLDELERQLAPENDASQQFTAPLMGALAEALDAEIARWERRARTDPDARAVLRAFLGVRELLWELGVRVQGEDAAARDDDGGDERTDHEHPDRPERTPRVQRIRVHG